MKAFSLTQPYASAVSRSIKQWETRSWPTNFRGEVCIHAAKGFPKWAQDFAIEERERLDAGTFLERLPLGAIIAICELTECRQTETLAPGLSELERRYGNYSPGRYAFKLDNVRVLANPIQARGMLKFWDVEGHIAKEVARQASVQS